MKAASLALRFEILCFAPLVAAAMLSAQACGTDDGALDVLDGDGGRRSDQPDAPAVPRDGAAPLSTLRLAHLAPELGAIDVCYQAARAGAFEGPILRTAAMPGDGGADAADPLDAGDDDAAAAPDAATDAGADAGDAGAGPALELGGVSKYFTLAATGTIVIAVVPAGATSCGAPIATGTVTLDPGKLSTVAVFGSDAEADDDAGADGGDADAGAPAIVAFTDDRETVADKARVRIVNAAKGGSMAVRVIGAHETVVADAVEPRRASSASERIPVDALGFATVEPVAPPASIAIGAWQSAPSDLDLRGESLHTGFVLGGPSAFAVVWCADKSTRGDRTACTVLRAP